MNRWHDKHIHQREFRVGDSVLLFNSRFKLFPGKLHSRWLGPFKLKKVYSYGAIKIGKEVTGAFQLNGSRLKYYIAGEPIDKKVTYDLPDTNSSCPFMVKLMTLKEHLSGGTPDLPLGFRLK